MKSNSLITQERLLSTLGAKNGCTNLFLKVLKSDLKNLLTQYMELEEIEFSLIPLDDGQKLNISIKVNNFLELGLNQE